MVLKKQTVWLLTMLSLIVVLSVYYITSPGGANNQMAAGTKAKQQQSASQTTKSKKGDTVTSSISSDNAFTAYKLQRDTARSKEIAQYQSVAASSKSTAVEASQALDQIKAIQTLASNESLLEDMIKSKGFKDALVKVSGNDVQIVVQTSSLSNKQANTIMTLSNQYFPNKIVSVKNEK